LLQWNSPCPGHIFDSNKRFERTYQYASGAAFRLARYIQATIVSIDEIDIGVPRRAKQHSISQRAAGGRVRCQIALAKVCFNFYYPSGMNSPAFAAHQDLAEQLATHAYRIARIKLPG